MTQAARWGAGAIALVAGGSLILQTALNTAESGSLPGAMWAMAIYFTILTNLAVAVAMGALALGRALPRMLILSLVAAIVGVGLVFHIALSHLIDPRGWDAVANQGVHTAAPIMSAVWWLAFAPADAPEHAGGWRRLGWVVVWPVLYSIYVLARGAVTGEYPYPFIDLPNIGWAALARNMAVLSVAFLGFGALLHGAVQLRSGHQPRRRSTI